MKYKTSIVLAYWRDQGLPEPKTEYMFHPERKWRADFCFPGVLIIEVDGGIWVGGRHSRGYGIVRDNEKLNAAAALGYRVLRFQPNELCLLSTVQMIHAVLGEQA